ncbi:hypothetical protein [Melghirimyces algeriensis]|uniref:Uncharacterized protein n=1 Tax=Melghirimyces algeriensis TaxID=910412 RepID=A0A521DUA6_9BACL|nr:hypothetical protein [Melghirimyces algeriensis]SMO74701.1 hypothetical protein SAMN06264849_106226 [Melghirimyces algeriensis]
MEHPFLTIQRNPWRFQSFSGYFVRWFGPEGVKRTPTPLFLEPHASGFRMHFFYGIRHLYCKWTSGSISIKPLLAFY